MRQRFRGMGKIFSFTFRHQAGKKGYIRATAIVAILCLLIPAGVMIGIAYFDDDRQQGTPETANQSQQVQSEEAEKAEAAEAAEAAAAFAKARHKLKCLYVVDTTGKDRVTVNDLQSEAFSAATGVSLADVELRETHGDLTSALAAAQETAGALILVVEEDAGFLTLNLLVPDEVEAADGGEDAILTVTDASALAPCFETYGQALVAQINGQNTQGDSSAEGDSATDGAEENDDEAMEELINGLLLLLLPYLNIMVLYFFILLYGQGVSQSVIMEKSSKLMDNFLITVSPEAMAIGKVTAVCAAGVLQLFLWIAALIGGFALGTAGVRAIDPQTDMLLIQLFDTFGGLTSGMFSVSGFLLALLMVLAGMLLYCAIAGIGGAMASKPEDLSSTNILFTLILVVSFFMVLLNGGMEGSADIPVWLDWLPFTSIMITPARILVGVVSIGKGIGCLLVTMATSLLCMMLAGRIYKTLALYKGKVPSPKKVWEMLRGV